MSFFLYYFTVGDTFNCKEPNILPGRVSVQEVFEPGQSEASKALNLDSKGQRMPKTHNQGVNTLIQYFKKLNVTNPK